MRKNEVTKTVIVSFEFHITADTEKALKAAIADIRECPASSCLCASYRNSYTYERNKKLGKVLSKRNTKGSHVDVRV